MTERAQTKPFSIRLTEAERDRLKREAGSQRLGPFMRAKLLGPDRRAMAQILAALGSSDLAASMREIADTARNGALEDTDDLRLSLHAACLTIEQMRNDLVRGLGLKVDAKR